MYFPFVFDLSHTGILAIVHPKNAACREVVPECAILSLYLLEMAVYFPESWIELFHACSKNEITSNIFPPVLLTVQLSTPVSQQHFFCVRIHKDLCIITTQTRIQVIPAPFQICSRFIQGLNAVCAKCLYPNMSGVKGLKGTFCFLLNMLRTVFTMCFALARGFTKETFFNFTIFQELARTSTLYNKAILNFHSCIHRHVFFFVLLHHHHYHS